MTTFKLGRWLLVALAIVGLAFAVPVGSAHGTDTTADDTPPYDGTTTDWAAWMEDHMGPGSVEWMENHMGPGSVEWMEDHTGLTADEMARDHDGYGPYEQDHHDDYHRGTYGQGHC
ncbi:hypothetical protein [Haloarcula onubensis]|uniref:Uncharacterized protein n=1 Tax=Haloarcula onubensis TaxID=2950539 RepID=A0ABU2FPK4_9EURY|nr:hypothetical protein [Halomicroarcula sp. S3CR25-11]MDS0282680.1 hypothetical protein [Halomicroarcula sp. S3CR25-11]